MAKDPVYVGIAVVGETVIPEAGKIISFAAAVKDDVFQANLKGDWMKPRFWEKQPQELWEKIIENQVSTEEGLKSFAEWLQRYQGNHIAVGRPLDFLWLFTEMVRVTKRCSFGSEGFFDHKTLIAWESKDYSMRGKRFVDKALLPWELAKVRGSIRIPTVEEKKAYKLREGMFRYIGAPEAQFRLQQAAANPAPAPQPQVNWDGMFGDLGRLRR